MTQALIWKTLLLRWCHCKLLNLRHGFHLKNDICTTYSPFPNYLSDFKVILKWIEKLASEMFCIITTIITTTIPCITQLEQRKKENTLKDIFCPCAPPSLRRAASSLQAGLHHSLAFRGAAATAIPALHLGRATGIHVPEWLVIFNSVPHAQQLFSSLKLVCVLCLHLFF